MSNLPMKIMCVNDKNKPQEIPDNKWIKAGEIYTLIEAQPLLSSNSLGFVLAEITLGEDCFPYHYFNADRFVPLDEQEMESVEAELHEILNPTIA